MNKFLTPADNDSDFGPTVPGQRWGEGSSSILPYLANSLKGNPNLSSLALARQVRAASKAQNKSPAKPEAAPPEPPAPRKPSR